MVVQPKVGEIFRSFLHLGLTAYGGLAMVEPIRHRVVQEKGWLTQKEFMDGLALCQIVPGATVVQLATYVGYRLHKTLGAVLAAIAFILPAFFLMLGLSFLYFKYGEISWVKSVSRGLNAVVIALLLQALWRLEENVRHHWLDFGIAVLALGSLWLGMQLSPGIFGGWRPEINSWLEVFPSYWLTHRGSLRPPHPKQKLY